MSRLLISDIDPPDVLPDLEASFAVMEDLTFPYTSVLLLLFNYTVYILNLKGSAADNFRIRTTYPCHSSEID